MPTILAVDDDRSMTDLYSALFSEEGFDVVTAEDTNVAMARLTGMTPDLAVLDAEMPGGGGERLFHVLRSRPEVIPVIFVTGNPEKVLSLALLRTKVRVLSKPLKNEELLAAVLEFCAPD